MRVRALLLLAVVPFLGTACSGSGDDAARDGQSQPAAATAADAAAERQAIDSALAHYIAAVTRGDTAAIVASFTDEPIVVFPAGPAVKGKADIAKTFAGMLATSPVRALEPTRTDLKVSGDMAVETGTFQIRMQPAGAKELIDKGQYLLVWQRQSDGSWKVARAFNRSDAPAK